VQLVLTYNTEISHLFTRGNGLRIVSRWWWLRWWSISGLFQVIPQVITGPSLMPVIKYYITQTAITLARDCN